LGALSRNTFEKTAIISILSETVKVNLPKCIGTCGPVGYVAYHTLLGTPHDPMDGWIAYRSALAATDAQSQVKKFSSKRYASQPVPDAVARQFDA
jgi:hypothetical protein